MSAPPFDDADPVPDDHEVHPGHRIAEILIPRAEIARRVRSLAEELRTSLAADGAGEDADLVFVPILTGAMIFVADLVRHLPGRLRIEVAGASSYRGKTTTPVSAPVLKGLDELAADLAGRHVVIVDDILDSGNTLKAMRAALGERHPASLRSCVLLAKEDQPGRAVPCEHVGFEIPDAFVVGYGLDYDGWYRNLPDIAVLEVRTD